MNDAGDVDVQQRLLQALAAFVEAYQARPELVTEQRGWSPVIALAASDARGAGGGVARRRPRRARRRRPWQAGAAPLSPTLEITGGLDTLCDVLMLRRDPNEPYLFGELLVVGRGGGFRPPRLHREPAMPDA